MRGHETDLENEGHETPKLDNEGFSILCDGEVQETDLDDHGHETPNLDKEGFSILCDGEVQETDLDDYGHETPNLDNEGFSILFDGEVHETDLDNEGHDTPKLDNEGFSLLTHWWGAGDANLAHALPRRVQKKNYEINVQAMSLPHVNGPPNPLVEVPRPSGVPRAGNGLR